MSIDFSCGRCGKPYRLAETMAGKKARCKACGNEFRVPQPRAVGGEGAWDEPADPYGLADPLPAAKPPAFEPEEPVRNPKRAGSWSAPSRRDRGEGNGFEQVRGLGLTFMVLGVASFILPMVGLQVKGLHRLDPESQAVGGLLLTGLGGLITLASYVNILKALLYAFGGFVGLMILGAVVLPMIRGRQPAPAMADPGAVPPGFAVPPPALAGPDFPVPPPVPIPVPTPGAPGHPEDPQVTISSAKMWRGPGPGMLRDWEFEVQYQTAGDRPFFGGQYFWVIESSTTRARDRIIPGLQPRGTLTGAITPHLNDQGPFETYIAREDHGIGGPSLTAITPRMVLAMAEAPPAPTGPPFFGPPPGFPFAGGPGAVPPPGFVPPSGIPGVPQPTAAPIGPEAPPPGRRELAGADLARSIEELKARDSFRCRSAAEALARATPVEERREEVVRELLTLVEDRDGFTRHAGAKALRVWGSADLLETWIKLLDDESFVVRWEAIAALGEMPDPRGAEAVAARLKADKLKASKALIQMGAVAEPAVLGCLGDPEWTVRMEAARILKQIGTKASVPVLQRALRDENGLVRMSAQDALRTLGASAGGGRGSGRR